MAASERSPKIDTKLVRELASILKDAELGEIEIEHGELRIRVSTASAIAPPAAAPQQMAMAPPSAQAAPAASAAPEAAAPAAETAAPQSEGTVTSPMVGTVYLSPEPGASPFVGEGQAVREGDTLMLVEAMKTFNPVTAPADGTVKSILVSDGQPVEYGEPLIVVA